MNSFVNICRKGIDENIKREKIKIPCNKLLLVSDKYAKTVVQKLNLLVVITLINKK